MNHLTWVRLHTLSPSVMATGDLYRNGRDEAIFGFPGAGLWIWTNNSVWQQRHLLEARRFLATGNVDGAGGDDLIAQFEGFGSYMWLNNAAAILLHPLTASKILTADVDGSGRDDVIVDFPGQGIWQYRNNSDWVQGPRSPEQRFDQTQEIWMEAERPIWSSVLARHLGFGH